MNQKIPEHSHNVTQRMATAKVVTKKEGKKGIDPKVAEKGWISLSSAKADTHNFHLRTKQTLSMQNFKVSISPPIQFLLHLPLTDKNHTKALIRARKT